MNHIENYFDNAAMIIQAAGKIAASADHRGDNGHNREVALCDFLNKHLPNRLNAFLGGKALGLGQAPSKQIDIFVKNDLAPKYEESEKSFVLCETIAAAISVKSEMNKEGIYDSLENLASIPQHSKKALSFHVVKDIARSEFEAQHPVMIAFGFNGVKAQTAVDHVNDFYSANSNIPENRKADIVLANCQYEISISNKDRNLAGGGVIPAGLYHYADVSESKMGLPLAGMINSISSHVSWLPYMNFMFFEYINEAYGIDA